MKRLTYLCLVGLFFAAAASAAPLYHIVPLGLDDLEHTRNDGFKSSFASGLNVAGQISGYSARYNGGSADLGRSAWLYDGATTIDIGLTGPEHTRNDGYKYTYVYQLMNEAGQVYGYSARYNGGSAKLGESAWLYDGATTIDIGLTGPEHTRNDGYKYSFAYNYRLNEAGQVCGYSERYNGGFSQFGLSAWLYDGVTTIDIGLTGPEHTWNNGYKYSVAGRLNEAGQVEGYSYRYNWLGRSAWLYDGATTIDIGLTGPEHTRNDGYKISGARGLNEAGQVSGSSERYNGGSTGLGSSAWLYDGVTTIDIGFTGPEHTRNDGYKYSEAQQMNEAGQVHGRSYRYNGGSTDLGNSAWLYDGVTTIDIGLTGPEHTRNDGYKYTYVYQLMNEAGQIHGFSRRFNGGSADLGNSAWLYDGVTTIDIGLTGPEHTRNDGYKISGARGLNEAGQVYGNSERYNGGSTGLGSSAWLYDGVTMINIGLTGPEHTSSTGRKDSFADQLNEAGQARGYSRRFNGGSADLGYSAWLYDGATTSDIGITSPEHTRNDGYERNVAEQMNEAGQVRGYSQRFNGGSTQLGQDAWFYDPALDQTFPLQLSVRSDGYAYSSVSYLGDDGLALGTYTLYDAMDNDLGRRAFYFTVADGLYDLGFFVDGGLAASGWDYLASAIRANGMGQILGYGKLTSQSGGQMVYLLTPIPIPEPSTCLLAAAAFAGLLLPRRAIGSRERRTLIITPVVAWSPDHGTPATAGLSSYAKQETFGRILCGVRRPAHNQD